MTFTQFLVQILTPLFGFVVAAAVGAITFYIKSIRSDVSEIRRELSEIKQGAAKRDTDAGVQAERVSDAVRRIDRIERKVWNGKRSEEAA